MKRIFLGTFFTLVIVTGIRTGNSYDTCEKAQDRATTAFRTFNFQMQYPPMTGYLFWDVWPFDATDALNEELLLNINEDDPKPDGYADLSILYHFKNGKLIVTDGLCAYGSHKDKTCKASKKSMFFSSDIYALEPDEFWGYEYITSPSKIRLNLIGVKLKADYGQIVFSLDEEANVIRGKIFCFLDIEKATNQRLPYWLPYIGDKTLQQVLSAEDRDEGPNGEDGWWFVFDFAAKPILYLQ